MKHLIKIILTVLFITSYHLLITLNAQVGINDNNASPDASAMLDVKSTDKGMLIPRMTTSQRDLINTPAAGLMIYNTTTKHFNYHNGTAWTEIGNDNLGNHTATANLQLNNNWLSNNGTNEGLKMDAFGIVAKSLTSVRPLLIQHNIRGNGTYLEVNNALGTRALFGADGSGFTGGSTSDVVIGNWSNGGLNFYANATKRVSISNAGLFQLDGNFKLVDGSQGVGKVLTSDANGLATWTTFAGGSDNLGNHIATQNIQLGSKWLSADGDNEGILITNTGQVGVGKVNTVNHLFQVSGDLRFYNDITTPSTTVTASNHQGAFTPNYIVDDNTITGAWVSFSSTAWLKFDLGSPQVLTHYSIRTGTNSPSPVTSPTNWTVEGSNDNSSWTVLDTKSTTIFATKFIDTFATNNTTAYQYYRLNNIQNNHSGAFAIQIMEMELFNAPPTNSNILTVSDIGDIKFNSAYTFPRVDGAVNQFLRTDGSGNLSWQDNVPSLISDADNNTKIQVEKTTNDDVIRFDIGGSEKMTLKRVNNNASTSPIAIGFPNNYGNVLLGENAGLSLDDNPSTIFGKFNTYIGEDAGKSDQNAYKNTYLGYQAGQNVINGVGNIFIGHQAGQNSSGANQLFIHNSNTTTPLIYGDFGSGLLRVNGSLNINNAYTLPTADGAANAVLKTNGSGTLSWTNTILDVAQLNGEILELSISGDNVATNQINLSTIDNQKTDVFQLNGNLLEFSLENDGIATQSLDLNAIDNQKTDVFQLSGDVLQFSLENDGIATQSVNLGAIDNQQLDALHLSGDNLQISLQNDGIATHSLNLSAIDNQQLDVFQLSGENLQVSLQNDGIATHSLNLNAIDNQKTDVFQLSGNSIQLSLENDGVATASVDLSHQISSKVTPLFLESNTAGQAHIIEFKNGTGTGAYFGIGGTGAALGGVTNTDLVIGNRGSGEMHFQIGPNGMYLDNNANLGIGMGSFGNNKLVVAGQAYKLAAGSWLTSSDRRLKKNIQPLSAEKMLEKLLAIQGVTYEWNDITGRPRPEGIQYGFIAQNVQEVFPSLVSEDDYGYLIMPYDTYDAMMVEGLRALNDKIERLENLSQNLTKENENLKAQVAKINQLEAVLQQLQAQMNNTETSIEVSK